MPRFTWGLAPLVALLASATGGQAAASTELTPACRVAQTYIEFIGARDIAGVRSLFAANAVYTGPDGVTVSDLDKITASYTRGLTSSTSKSWRFRVANLLPFGANGCLLEFETAFDAAGDFQLAAVDRIEVDKDEKISRFLPYIASPQLKRIFAHLEHRPGQ